jgi:hypothetical protein
MSTPVYHARLYGQVGAVATIDRALTFLDTATGEVTVLTPPDCNWLAVPGDLVAAAEAPTLCARMRGQHEHLNCQMGG